VSSEQLNIFGEPERWDPRTRARRTDPQTSHDAAESLDARYIRESQAAVRAFLLIHGPMTQSELCRRYDGEPAQSDSGLRTRLSELVQGGLARDTGEKTRLPSGRWAIIWSAVG
jgi:hypothetical protein